MNECGRDGPLRYSSDLEDILAVIMIYNIIVKT